MAVKRDVAPTEAGRCSHDRLWPNAVSPDGRLVATLAPSGADDERWTGPSRLTLTRADTEEVVWQRDLQVSARRVTWSPDGRFLFFDDGGRHSPIWRVPVGEPGDPEIVVEDGYLLHVPIVVAR